MIISQAPLRISLFGGGSDLPAFLDGNDGAVLSFAIDKRVYIVGHPLTHRGGIMLKYSKFEDVKHAEELAHPIARVVLSRYGINDIDIAVMSDIPAGTGLGSSSAFTVALLAFVRKLAGLESTPRDLASEACDIEINVLGEPIGYQDQWASALGGLNHIEFRGNDEVSVERICLSAQQVIEFEQSMFLVPIGAPRSASELLRKQSKAISESADVVSTTIQMVQQVAVGRNVLQGELNALGPLLGEAWALKKLVSGGVSNETVDAKYDAILRAGATGAKLLGAGGSGYLASFVPADSRSAFFRAHPDSLPVRISKEGAGVIHES